MIRRLRNRFGYRVRNRVKLIAFALSGGADPIFASGAPTITMTTTAAVTAGRVVEISGDRSIRLGQSATIKGLGVAKQTADAVGDKVGVATGGVWNLLAQGAIAAGDRVLVSAGNDGRVAPQGAGADKAVIGIALAAIADGATGPVLLRTAS